MLKHTLKRSGSVANAGDTSTPVHSQKMPNTLSSFELVNEKTSLISGSAAKKPKLPTIVTNADEAVASVKNETNRLWYEILPTDDKIDDYAIEPLDRLICDQIQEEFRLLKMKAIINEFSQAASEFLELTARKRELEPTYSKILVNYIDIMCRVFDCQITPMFVDINKYTAPKWGAVFWRFLHYGSILLSYAFEQKLVDSFLNFATIVYQIHLVLPCPVCKSHYMSIRESQDVIDTIKCIAFGLPVTGVHRFHNIITNNVDTFILKTSANRERRRPFVLSDFVRTYNCYTFTDETLTSSTNYVSSYFDWQPTTHALLSIIMATYARQPYMRASCCLKTLYNATINLENYKLNTQQFEQHRKPQQAGTSKMLQQPSEQPKAAPFYIKKPALNIVMMHASDEAFAALTPKQLKYLLVRALLLQFQNTEHSTESIHNNVELNSAIIEMYIMYPKICLELVKRNLNTGTVADAKIKRHISETIYSLHKNNNAIKNVATNSKMT